MSFTAQFNTLCGACESWIRPGDQITVGAYGSIHADCDPDAVPKPERLAPPCEKCWQVPAASGVCGCDE